MRHLIRMMEIEDIKDIVSKEKEIFGRSLGEDFLISELKVNPFSQYIVIDINGIVSGYIGLWIADNIQVVNFLIDKKYQGLGYGSILMEFAIKVAIDSKVKNISLEVRPSNIKAISFYKKHGFLEQGKRKKYYEDGEDAILMVKEVRT